MFTLHPQLASDTIELGDFPLCRLLLMNDAQFPWCILVPRRDDILEAFELEEADQLQLHHESLHLTRFMAETFAADKMNVAALGNIVPQLHIHHIARFEGDPAWPRPVWGLLAREPYSDKEVQIVREIMAPVFEGFTAP